MSHHLLAGYNNFMIKQKTVTTSQEREILGIIDDEAKQIGFGKLSIELIIKDGKIVRVEASSTKKEYKL